MAGEERDLGTGRIQTHALSLGSSPRQERLTPNKIHHPPRLMGPGREDLISSQRDCPEVHLHCSFGLGVKGQEGSPIGQFVLLLACLLVHGVLRLLARDFLMQCELSASA